MKPVDLMLFLIGALLTYGVFLAIRYGINSALIDWQFHLLHGAIAFLIACSIEAYTRHRLRLKSKVCLQGNPHTKQFLINLSIWFGLLALVFSGYQIPQTDFKLLLYSVVIYLAFSSLMGIFKLVTLGYSNEN